VVVDQLLYWLKGSTWLLRHTDAPSFEVSGETLRKWPLRLYIILSG
jgi:hypothetical protein